MAGVLKIQRLEFKTSGKGNEYVDAFGSFSAGGKDGHLQSIRGFGPVVQQLKDLVGDQKASKDNLIEVAAIVDFKDDKNQDGTPKTRTHEGKTYTEKFIDLAVVGPVGADLQRPDASLDEVKITEIREPGKTKGETPRSAITFVGTYKDKFFKGRAFGDEADKVASFKDKATKDAPLVLAGKGFFASDDYKNDAGETKTDRYFVFKSIEVKFEPGLAPAEEKKEKAEKPAKETVSLEDVEIVKIEAGEFGKDKKPMFTLTLKDEAGEEFTAKAFDAEIVTALESAAEGGRLDVTGYNTKSTKGEEYFGIKGVEVKPVPTP